MRTPIAAALAQAQRLLAEAPSPAMQDRARQIESSLRALARITEKLMQLAKAEGGGVLSETAHDLVPLVGLVAEEFKRTADGSRLRVTVPDSPVLSHLDPDALAILLRNLIENAVKHGAADEPVTIALGDTGLLSVSNGGPAVPAETLLKLTGLGLAIADAIASGAEPHSDSSSRSITKTVRMGVRPEGDLKESKNHVQLGFRESLPGRMVRQRGYLRTGENVDVRCLSWVKGLNRSRGSVVLRAGPGAG